MDSKGAGKYRPKSSRFSVSNRKSAANDENRPRTAALPPTRPQGTSRGPAWRVQRATVVFDKASAPVLPVTKTTERKGTLNVPKRTSLKTSRGRQGSKSDRGSLGAHNSAQELEAAEEADDPIGWKIYAKGSLNCPTKNTKNTYRCQLWRVPQPKPLHNPVWRGRKFINDNYHFICPTQDLYWNGIDNIHV